MVEILFIYANGAYHDPVTRKCLGSLNICYRDHKLSTANTPTSIGTTAIVRRVNVSVGGRVSGPLTRGSVGGFSEVVYLTGDRCSYVSSLNVRYRVLNSNVSSPCNYNASICQGYHSRVVETISELLGGGAIFRVRRHRVRSIVSVRGVYFDRP